MTARLPGTDWLLAAETRAVMSALAAPGTGESRFVGGCVRNTLMGRPVDDIDIATQLLPAETLAALEAAGIRAIPTGIEHGTITAVVNSTPYEVTSLRRDVETDGRRAVVAFTRDWGEDAMRRDFRLNAIYADPDGTLHDPTGAGIEDAASGRVIFIGDADQRLREDYLRILRFFRFNAWYGARMDEDGLAACARQKDGLKKIAAERIWKEFRKLLGAPEPVDSLAAMERSGVLEIILPGWQRAGLTPDKDVTAGSYIQDMCDTELHHGVEPDPMRRLMSLLVREEAIVLQAAQGLKLSNQERDRLLAWARVNGDTDRLASLRGVRAEQYRAGRAAMLDWALWMSAHDVWQALQDNGEVPVLPLKGEDLVKAGLTPGPAIGETLRALETIWIESDFQMSKRALLEELERRLKAD